MTNAESIATWINHALRQGDAHAFEILLPDSPNIWAPVPDGPNITCQYVMGRWCDISREALLEEIAKRIASKPQCTYYASNIRLDVETFGWDPLWVWPFGEADGVLFSFHREDSVSNEYLLSEVFFLSEVHVGDGPWLTNTACPNEGEIGQIAIWVSPSSTWEEMQNCLYSSSSSSECIPSIMEKYGASQEAIAFSTNFGDNFFLVDFEEVGRVDLGVIFYPGRANDNWQNVLLNGFPQLVSAENMFDIDITTSPGYQALSQQSSNPLLWSTDNNLYAIEPRPEGGQRFVFTYPIYNGCHACGIVSHALVAFDFDTEGRFLGSVLLSLDSSQP